jgi:predicted PurR-regulated permease PerM
MDTPSWRSRIPHAALWVLVAGALLLAVAVLSPLLPTLLIAGAVAVLAGPVLHRPVVAWLGRHRPAWSEATRAWLAAAFAVTALGAVAGTMVLAVLAAVLGSLGATWDAVAGIAVHDQVRIAALAQHLAVQAEDLDQLLGLDLVDPAPLAQRLADFFDRTQVGAEVLQVFVTGTGSAVARGALVAVTVFYLFLQGPALIAWLVRWLPLRPEDLDDLARAHAATASHLLVHLLARAAAVGIGLGGIAWAVAGYQGVLIAVAATVLALLPLVGPLVAWLPLVLLAAQQGQPVQAAALAVLGLAWWWLVDWWASRAARRRGTGQVWLGFLVFLGLVGGLLGHGPAGLVVGPAAVLVAVLAARAVWLVYRTGPDDSDP